MKSSKRRNFSSERPEKDSDNAEVDTTEQERGRWGGWWSQRKKLKRVVDTTQQDRKVGRVVVTNVEIEEGGGG